MMCAPVSLRPDQICLVVMMLLWAVSAQPANERLIIDATARMFHWEKDYSVGISPQGPTFKVGNLALHLTRGYYSDQLRRPAQIAIYDSRADASRVFLATGYQFEVSHCDSTFLILNWTGTMGDQELTLIQLELSQTDGYWHIAQITMTQHGTKRNSTIRDVAPWAKDCQEARENPPA